MISTPTKLAEANRIEFMFGIVPKLAPWIETGAPPAILKNLRPGVVVVDS